MSSSIRFLPTFATLMAILIAGLAVSFLWGGPFSCGKSPGVGDRAFDREIWLAHADMDELHNPRWAMIKDVRSRIRIGTFTRSEVIALLGPPSLERDGDLYYAVGWWSAFEMDANSLDVSFGPDGTVKDIRLHQH